MTEGITIRPANMADIDTLLVFEQGIIAAERPFDPTLKRTDDTRYYDIPAMIEAPHIQLLVALDGERLIGSGYARIENAKPYLQHAQYAYLGFMYVEPTWRGKGVNRLIIDALTAWSVKRGITEIRLEVYTENNAAIRAYEKTGFQKYMLTMRMKA